MNSNTISINGKMVKKDITTLYLFANKLTYLPLEIGQFTQLTILNLNFNQLTYLPVEIG